MEAETFRRESGCASVVSVPHDSSRSAWKLLASMIRGVPFPVQRNWSTSFDRLLDKERKSANRILVDHFLMGPYIPEDFPGKFVLHQHNAEHIIWRRFAQNQTKLIHKAYATWESHRIARYETILCRRANRVLAAPNDIDALQQIGVDRQKMQETFHLGDPRQITLPDIPFQETQPKLFYAGSLRWEPNIDGLLWFLQSAWPAIRSYHPEVELVIAGDNPDPRLANAVVKTPNVQLLGYVDDLESIQSSCRVAIAPLRFGSGMKVKVMDALARGLPMVTTTIGSEGLVVQDGVHLRSVDQAEAFAMAVVELLDNQAKWEYMRDNARSIARQRYSWEPVLESMEGALCE